MNKKLKASLKKEFEAPAPQRKKEFLQKSPVRLSAIFLLSVLRFNIYENGSGRLPFLFMPLLSSVSNS